jgi:glycosyltransferase involved in cell wall biosynthesis
VALPIRDAERTLPFALASILAQTYDSWELLVLDDYSSDRSKDIALETAALDPRVRVLEPTGSGGLVPRLNQAMAAARGMLFARMDADDVAYPARLKRQVEFLRANPSVDVVGTSMFVFREEGIAKGVRTAPVSHEAICARPASGFRLFHPTWMGRLEWFRTYQYREEARRCEDQELLLRACPTSRFANLPEPLLGYREDRVNLRSGLQGRMNFAGAVMRQEFRRRHPARGVAAAVEQAGKAVVDITAVTLGVESHLLSHRAKRAPLNLIVEWERIWLATVRHARRLHGDPALQGEQTRSR